MNVMIYTTPTCPYCRQAKEYLRSQGVPYQEKNVAADQHAAQEMVQRSGQNGVPVIVIDGEMILGFDRPGIDRALSKARSGRPRLGAAVASASQVAGKYGLGIHRGAYVGRVNPGTAADRGGLKAGDVILALAGQPIQTADDIDRVVSGLSGGQRVPAVIWRGGRQMQIEIGF